MKKILIYFMILCFKSDAQNYFNLRFDNNNSAADYGFSVFSDSIKNYIVFGTYYNDGIGNLLSAAMLQLDLSGNILDTNFYIRPYESNSYAGGPGSLSKTKNGFVLGGSYEDSTGTNAFIIKIKSNGDTDWTKIYGDTSYQSGWMAKQSNEGGFLLCGQTSSYDYDGDMFFLKTDSLGNIIWERNYGMPNISELAFGFTTTSDGGFALAGERQIDVHNTDIYIVKTDSNGTLQWDTTLGGLNRDRAWSITSTQDGNFVVAGYYSYGLSQMRVPYIIKMDLSGSIIWQKQYGDTFILSTLYSIRELTDGSLIVVGNCNFPNPLSLGLIFKIDSNGDSLWSQTYYNLVNSANYLDDICPTIDGGFVACGTILPHLPDTGNQDLWILKIDSLGCEIANCTLGLSDFLLQRNLIKVYPNPFSDELNIVLPEQNLEFEIQLYDGLGRKIKQIIAKGNQNYILDNKNLVTGLYFLRILHGDNIVYNGKINFVSR